MPNFCYLKVQIASSDYVKLIQHINKAPLLIEFDMEKSLLKFEDVGLSDFSNFLQKISQYCTIISYTSNSKVSENIQNEGKNTVPVESLNVNYNQLTLIHGQQKAIFNEFDEAFKKLSQTGNIDEFFLAINMQDELLRKICIEALKLDKITFANIAPKIDMAPSMVQIQARNSFNTWLENHPNLKKNFNSNISFTEFLKVIQRAFKTRL